MENRLKRLREQNKKTQAEVAKYLGISQQSYGRYETENLIPSGEILDRLADFYNVTIDYLVGKSNIPEARNLDADFQVIHRAFQGMDENKKEKFKKMLSLSFDIFFSEDDDDKK